MEEKRDLSIKMLLGDIEEVKTDTRVTRLGHRNTGDLAKVLREVAMNCKPCEFRFNQWAIKYIIKDDFGCLRLRWVVYDGVTGNTKEFYNKDFVSDNGQVLWRKLAKEIKKV